MCVGGGRGVIEDPSEDFEQRNSFGGGGSYLALTYRENWGGMLIVKTVKSS